MYFVSGGWGKVYRDEKLPEASLMSSRANASSSRTELLLTKAEPVRNDGDTSVVTDLRRKRSYCACVIVAREEQGENM